MDERSDPMKSDALVRALYGDLQKLAHRELHRAGSPQTWQTTAIINETWLKLHRYADWRGREHFLGVAATAMRHILVDAARARLTARRGGGSARLPLEAADQVAAGEPDREIARLGEALIELTKLDPDLAQLVDCRYFAGLSEVETAQVLGVSDRTVRRRWAQARAWIHREIQADG